MANIIYKDSKNMKKSLLLTHKKALILCTVLSVVVVVFACAHSNEKINMDVQNFDESSLRIENYGSSATDDDIDIIYNNTQQPPSAQTIERTTISIEDTGRSDPFLPGNEIVVIKNKNTNRPKASYDLLPPPETITTDTTATEVMTTKVSGLMYDRISPSAIININNIDYLVRKGDIVNDYKVLDITRNTVTVQYGANVYKAGVGELFTGDGINYNTISNLEKKFGGAKNSANRK